MCASVKLCTRAPLPLFIPVVTRPLLSRIAPPREKQSVAGLELVFALEAVDLSSNRLAWVDELTNPNLATGTQRLKWQGGRGSVSGVVSGGLRTECFPRPYRRQRNPTPSLFVLF